MTTDEMKRVRDLLGEYFDGYLLVGFPIDNPNGSAFIRDGLTRDTLERMATHLEIRRKGIMTYLEELDAKPSSK